MSFLKAARLFNDSTDFQNFLFPIVEDTLNELIQVESSYDVATLFADAKSSEPLFTHRLFLEFLEGLIDLDNRRISKRLHTLLSEAQKNHIGRYRSNSGVIKHLLSYWGMPHGDYRGRSSPLFSAGSDDGSSQHRKSSGPAWVRRLSIAPSFSDSAAGMCFLCLCVAALYLSLSVTSLSLCKRNESAPNR